MSPSWTRTGPRRAGGFSLLEVLVAFVILATVLGVIMRIYSQDLERVSDSDYQTRAVLLAESKMALLGAEIPLEEGETSGEGEDGLRWRLRLSDYDPDRRPDEGKLGTVRAVLPARLLRVDLEVSWGGDGAAADSLRLTTLRLVPRSVL